MNFAQKSLYTLNILLSPKRASYFLKVLREAGSEFKNNELIQILNEVPSDKGRPGHNYARIYDYYLRHRKNEIRKLCEIGLLRHSLQSGEKNKVYNITPSLYVWERYMPHAQIVGFDIRSFKNPASRRVRILEGDQSNREHLKQILEASSEYDVIIDDALHASYHQQISFSFLFGSIKSGGYYFIEDINHQPQTEHEREDIPTTRKLLRTLQETGQWLSPVSTKVERDSIEQGVAKIKIYDSVKDHYNPELFRDAIAVIKKK